MRELKGRNRLRPRGRMCLAVYLAGIAGLFILTSSCHYYNLERKLDRVNRDWINKVRYIITSEERKMFLDIPAEEREGFKEEFWARRDPDPETEENEFKMEYYGRIERADELFVSEGRPGWMTDRGRIYILFGPPMDRLTYPQSYAAACQEIWYYGQFPVVFMDTTCTGQYKLITYNLTGLRSMNLMYMHELGQAQAQAQQTVQGQSGFFNFTWKANARLVNNSRVEGNIRIEVPMANVWFRDEDDLMKTELDLRVEIKGADEELVWEFEQTYDIETTEEGLASKQGRKYEIEVPFVITDGVDRLRKGRNLIFAFLTNRTGESRVRKVLSFVLK